MSSNFYPSQTKAGKVSVNGIDVSDAIILGEGKRDTDGLALANESGLTFIPNKNNDLKALLDLASQLADSAQKIASSPAVIGEPINTEEATKLIALKAQLDEFVLS